MRANHQDDDEDNARQQFLVPLARVDVKTELRGHTAYTSVEMTYVNPDPESALECTYIFPVDSNHLIAKFEVEVEGKVIVAKVIEKERALEKYEDAVAAGNFAVFSELQGTSKQDESLLVKLGNLHPKQKAVLKAQIITQMEVIGGFYCFKMPVAFHPDYAKHGVVDANLNRYDFNCETRIESLQCI